MGILEMALDGALGQDIQNRELGWHAESVSSQRWEPVLRPDTRQNKDLKQDDERKKSHLALDPKIKALEARIGHIFTNQALIAAALTHVSAAAGGKRETYQRLEFLGDHVLGLVISELLFTSFAEADEGELSRRLAGLVRKESCAAVARAWGVDSIIRLGEGEHPATAAKATVLCDVCESIIGAIFLDAGYEAAKAVVTAAFYEEMRAPGRPLNDSKTELQEWAQARGLPPPLYRETARSGPDHAPEFTIRVEVPGYPDAEAKGFAKRLAEQAAAAAFIAREDIGHGGQKGAA